MRGNVSGPLMIVGAVCTACLLGGLHLADKPFDWRYAELLGYFILVTMFLLHWQEGAAERTNIFIRRFMAGLVIKLMGSLLLLAILVKTAPAPMIAPLAIVFAGLYLVFMAYSVARLMNVVKSKQP